MEAIKFKDALLSLVNQHFGPTQKQTETPSELMPVIKSFDEDLMQAVEVVFQPFVVDAHGDWLSQDTIRKACTNFNVNLEKGHLKANLFHLKETDKFTILKSWINEVDSVIGDTQIPEGTWLVKVQYNDPKLWEQKKSGIIQGVSIGGKGVRHDPEIKSDDVSKSSSSKVRMIEKDGEDQEEENPDEKPTLATQ